MAEPNDPTPPPSPAAAAEQQPTSLAELLARAEKLDAEVRKHLEVLKKAGERGQ